MGSFQIFVKCKNHGLLIVHFCTSNPSLEAPLEMLFQMVSCFAEVKIFDFWPKTMDYSQAFF